MEIGVLKTPLGKTKLYWFGSMGETVLITAGIHGNEHNSILVARNLIRLLKKLDEKLFDGRVIILPIANPNAFRYKSRQSIIDGLDLNRVFPGDSERSATYRHASAIWGIAQTVDYIIDLHTCGYCEPYILTLHKDYDYAREFAEKLPIRNVVESSGLGGQLFIEALKNGIKSAIIELPQEDMKVDLEFTRRIAEELLQSLINIGILNGESKKFEHEYYDTIVRIHADNSGLYKPSKKIGDIAEKGDILGRIAGIPIKIKYPGKIVILKPTMFVTQGEFISGIAQFLG